MCATVQIQSVSAAQARQSFFNMLTQTQASRRSFAIHKRSQLVVYLSSQIPASSKPNIMQFAGMWGSLTKKDLRWIESIYHQRSFPSHLNSKVRPPIKRINMLHTSPVQTR